MKPARWAGLGLALVVSLSAASPPITLTVFAAASLKDAFEELGNVFEREHPGLEVRFNFAGSQQLAVQLEQGARADVFASADQRWMSYAQERALLATPPAVFARNRLVVILPGNNPGQIARLTDLARSGVKLVLAAEAVPAGRYTRELLDNLAHAPGFPADYSQRVLANQVSQEENVKAVLAKVQLGEADAGVVYRSDVSGPAKGKLRVLEVPDSLNVIASYPVARVKNGSDLSAARGFIELLLSPKGQEALQRHGLIPVER